ncbi:MAG: hypothetical protein HYU39_08555 [Thaumarchaeota archaeon]|nr:hypothetical protein [Nitrososphaerota archaeon]
MKSALDTAEYIVNLFLSKFASSKTDPWDPSKVSTVNVKDTELIEKSFDDTYKELEKLPPEKIEKWKAMFDWVESWVMEEWSELVSKGTTIIIEDFRDTLKQLILEANRILDDNFQKLRLELDNKKCEWNCSADVENRLKTHINRSDAPHLAYASAFPSSSNGGPIFVTNDEGILLKKKDIEKIAKLLVVRPAFAYAYNAMKTSGSMLNK